MFVVEGSTRKLAALPRVTDELIEICLLDVDVLASWERLQIDERDLGQALHVERVAHRVLEMLEYRYGVVLVEEDLFVHGQQGHRESKQHFAALQQKAIPNTQKSLWKPKNKKIIISKID